jgi:hypothetical protein
MLDVSVRRAIVLMGTRRVGKTVMVYHGIRALLDKGIDAQNILYISLETPVYTGLPLAKLVSYFQELFEHRRDAKLFIVKWSDRPYRILSELDNCVAFVSQNPTRTIPVLVTSETIFDANVQYGGVQFMFSPASVYAYELSANLLTTLSINNTLEKTISPAFSTGLIKGLCCVGVARATFSKNVDGD